MVIPIMDHIDKHLATSTTNDNYSFALKAALAMGKKTLNRYYNKTNHSEVYWITMGNFHLLKNITPFNLIFFSSTPQV